MQKKSFTPTLRDLNKISGSKIDLINRLARLSPLFLPALAALWVATTGYWQGIDSVVNKDSLKEVKQNLLYAAAWAILWLFAVVVIIISLNRQLPEMLIA